MIKKKRRKVSRELRRCITLALLEPGCDVGELARKYNLARLTLLRYRQQYRKQQASDSFLHKRSPFVEVKVEDAKIVSGLTKVELSFDNHRYPTIVKFFADAGYAGALQIWCFLTLGSLLAIARKIVDQVGFKVIPKRWIIERTFAWFNNFRRMSKDYEHNPKTSEHIVYINMITIMLKRLAEP